MSTRRVRHLTVALAAIACFITVTTTEAQDAGGEVAVRALYLADNAQLEKKLVSLAEAFSQEQYDWRPAPGVRSTREVLGVIIGENAALLPFAFGQAGMDPFPAGSPGFAAVKTAVDGAGKAAIVEWLRRSFTTVRAAWNSEDAIALGKAHDFFGSQMVGSRMAVITLADQHEHLGQLIAYARMNGVVPPWSRTP